MTHVHTSGNFLDVFVDCPGASSSASSYSGYGTRGSHPYSEISSSILKLSIIKMMDKSAPFLIIQMFESWHKDSYNESS